MHLGVVIGLLLALTCAAGANVAGLWKQKGAVQVRDVDIHHPVETAVALFRSKWFTIGWLAAAVAWFLHIGALALAPLSLAQAVFSGGLVLLGLLAERFFGFEVTRRQWIALAVLAFGMVVLAATAHAERNRSNYGILPIVVFELACVGLGLVCVITYGVRGLGEHRGVALAIAAGILFGACDVSIKAITSGAYGLLGVLGPWTLIGLLAGLGAFYASARSLQIGNAVAVIAATSTAANLLGIIGGITVFGDPLGHGAPAVGGRLLGFVLVLLAVALLPAPVRAQRAVSSGASEGSRGVV